MERMNQEMNIIFDQLSAKDQIQMTILAKNIEKNERAEARSSIFSDEMTENKRAHFCNHYL